MQIISRKDALKLGLPHYFTGRPCVRGHCSERYTAGWACISCQPIHNDKHKKPNPKTLAIAASEPRYITGKPCRNGHIAERYTDSGRCVICFAEHAERHRKRASNYYYANREIIRAQMRRAPRPKALAKAAGQEYYFTGKPCSRGHTDKRRVTDGMCMSCVGLAVLEWNKKNPEASRAIVIRRRARKRNAPGKHTGQQIKGLMIAQKAKCAYCRTSIKRKWHVDHIQALVKGGSNAISNIQLLCPQCNQRKNAKDPIAFAQELGFLL